MQKAASKDYAHASKLFCTTDFSTLLVATSHHLSDTESARYTSGCATMTISSRLTEVTVKLLKTISPRTFPVTELEIPVAGRSRNGLEKVTYQY